MNSLNKSRVWLAELALLFCSISNLAATAGSIGPENSAPEVTIDLSKGPIAEFLPNEAFGAAVDGQKQGQIAAIYSPQNVEQMLRTGFNQGETIGRKPAASGKIAAKKTASAIFFISASPDAFNTPQGRLNVPTRSVTKSLPGGNAMALVAGRKHPSR